MATKEYRTESDILGEFLADRCVEMPQAEVRSKSLYQSYKDWANESGEKPMTQKMLGMRLSDRGFEKKHTRNGDVWLGVGLVEREPCEGSEPNFSITNMEFSSYGVNPEKGSHHSHPSHSLEEKARKLGLDPYDVVERAAILEDSDIPRAQAEKQALNDALNTKVDEAGEPGFVD